ncbi:unnamed protein product [Rotaria sp. Silwood2]|nr:unnamed protein product [Rotaria sp. Silwood2]CAF2726806.1 unnamed protein product [Rotaria sp. Silwood2]CAF3108334.1 unnamed protein product [Rotaria sp. Silwood2]CAF3889830.1 unnamed protein product [Rotaria sp. Silwood2]CAF3952015.1 unnamed protein product [Rotaria sp. Silwood2]
MGSEHLSHLFAAKDPAYKDSSFLSKFHANETHPVSADHSKKARSSLSSIKKLKLKHRSEDKKLIKLYSRQLSHIETTVDAIESLSKSKDTEHIKIILSYRKRLTKLNQDFENLRHSLTEENDNNFNRMKIEIEQLINDLKLYKMNNDDSGSKNPIDYVVNFSLDAPNSENDEEIISMQF